MTDPKDPKDGWVGGGEKSAPGIDFKWHINIQIERAQGPAAYCSRIIIRGRPEFQIL